MDMGLPVASTLRARTRPHCRFVFLQSKVLFPASFSFPPRLPVEFHLAVPYGYLNRSRQDRFILLESAHAGHTGARLQTCRVAIRGDMSVRHDQSIRVGASQPLSQPRARHTNFTNKSRSDRGHDTAPLGSDNSNR